MKNRFASLPTVFGLLVVSLAGPLHGTTSQFWNVTGDGGDGNWSTGPGDKNWNLAPNTALGSTTWLDNVDDVAVFHSANAGIVTIFDTVRTAGIVQSGANHAIDAGTIILARDSSLNAPFINVQTGTLTINSELAGSDGMVKIGAGILNVTAANPYSGPTAVQAGTLVLTGSVGSDTVQIASGASLINPNGGLANSATLTNAGSLTVDANDTINTYLSNGGTLTAGVGTLFTNSASLGGGSTVAGLLNAVTLTSNGAVAISGTATAGSALVQTGVLTLSGPLVSDNVQIASGSSLINQSGGLSNSATLTNGGSLTLNANDTITSYLSNGGTLTAGAGTLFATTASLGDGSSISGRLTTATMLTSTGNVAVSGILTGQQTTLVESGTLTLTGTLNTTNLNISSGATLIQNGNIGPQSPASARPIVINAGSLILEDSAQFRTYTSNGGLLDIRGGRMITDSTFLNDGSVTIGRVFSAGVLETNGAVRIESSALGSHAYIQSGVLDLVGSLGAQKVEISSGASLLNQNGGLSSSAYLSNRGSLTMNAADTIHTYASLGGTLTAGAGTLFATNADLRQGSSVAGLMNVQSLLSTGAVNVSGTITAGTATLQGSVFTLGGSLISDSVMIDPRSQLINVNGGLSATATVDNQGRLILQTDDRIAAYLSEGGVLEAGAGVLYTDVARLNRFAQIDGHLDADQAFLNDDQVRIRGQLSSRDVRIQSGQTVLTGVLSSPLLAISPGASLLNESGGLSNDMVLTNSGRLRLLADDTIARYVSNGGNLDSSINWLTTSDAELNDGSLIGGRLRSGVVTSDGAVLLSGRLESPLVDVRSGVMTNTGLLDAAAGRLNLAGGATLVASGVQSYGLLTTSGTGVGTWQGDLVQTAAVAPGGVGGGGTLRVTGDLTNAAGGLLRMDVSPGTLDRLVVDGSVLFGGVLELSQPGAPITPFVPVTLVEAGSYVGNFSSMAETLTGPVFFNPGNGTVTRLEFPSGDSLYGLTANQTSTWLTLYDDVIDPGVSNVTSGSGGGPPYQITSGIADPGNPDLLWTLAASFVPGGLDRNLLNHLSGEVYISLADYATQATRHHQRTALAAPSLGAITGAVAKGAKDGMGAKGGLEAVTGPRRWEGFAAADYFSVGTEHSENGADFDLEGLGLIVGARTQWNESLRIAGYLGADDGSIHGGLIDADVLGFTMGVTGEWRLDDATRVMAAVSFGNYGFDGTRRSVSATSAGWQPGSVDFDDVNSTSFEWFLGVERLIHEEAGFRFSVSAGLRYAFGSMDGFSESTGNGPGSPLALEIGRDGYGALLAESAIRVENRVTERLLLHGELGFNFGINEESHGIRSSFARGAGGMMARAAGLEDDLLFLSIGGIYDLTERVSVAVGYRGELRGDDEALHGFGISSSFGF